MDGEENKIEAIQEKYGKAHYHGDMVRKLFVAAGAVMIITLPFLSHRLPLPPFFSALFIVILGSAAGFVSPKSKWIIPANFVISAFGVLVFEYFAVSAYQKYSLADSLFLTDQILALIFLFALYYSAKTFRSKLTEIE